MLTKILTAVVAVALVLGLVKLYGDSRYDAGVGSVMKASAETLVKALDEQKREFDAQLAARDVRERERETVRIEALAARDARIEELEKMPPKVLVRTEIRDANCPAVPAGLSNDFWLRFRAAGRPAG